MSLPPAPLDLPPLLPDPAILRGYQDVDDSIPEACLALVWEETKHRHAMERLTLDAQRRRASRSLCITQGSMLCAVAASAALLAFKPVITWPLVVAVIALLCVPWGVPMFVSRKGMRLGRGGAPDEPESHPEGVSQGFRPR
jgi:hypothetical protein